MLATVEEPPDRLLSGEEGGVDTPSSLDFSVTTVECGAERRCAFGEREREREREWERGDESCRGYCCGKSCLARGEIDWVSVAGGASAVVGVVAVDFAVLLRGKVMTWEPDSTLGCPAASGYSSTLRYMVGRERKQIEMSSGGMQV